MTDPDGNSVQIWADQSWKMLSNAAPEKYPMQEALFHAIGMHHIAVQSGNLSKSVEFYGFCTTPPTQYCVCAKGNFAFLLSMRRHILRRVACGRTDEERFLKLFQLINSTEAPTQQHSMVYRHLLTRRLRQVPLAKHQEPPLLSVA